MRPYLLSSVAGAGADGSQIFLLPLVSNLVRLSVIVAGRGVCKDTQTNTMRSLGKVAHFEMTQSQWAWLEEVQGLTWLAFELPLAVADAGAAHHLAVFRLAVPLLADAVVVAAVMAPFWGEQKLRNLLEPRRSSFKARD